MNQDPVHPVIPVAIVVLLSLFGCDSAGLQAESATARLKIGSSPNSLNSTVIPIDPRSVPDRDSAGILTANLQTESEKDSVLLRKVVVGIQASASLSSVLAGATLTYAKTTYPLDRVIQRRDSTGFLVFDVSRSEKPLVVTDNSQPLQLLAQFKAGADKEVVQASIGFEASRRTVAVQAANGLKLSAKQKTGSAYGKRYRLRRSGAYLQTEDISATRIGQSIRYEIDMLVSAFATDVSIPWLTHRTDSSVSRYPESGFYYAVEDTSGQSLAGGRVESITLESTTATTSAVSSLSKMRIRESEERAVTLSVRYRPEKQGPNSCLRLNALKYQIGREGTHVLPLSDTVCASR